MFKSGRWRSEKNRIKAEFKLQFCATQISEFGGDSLTISVVPGDVGKPTLRLEKAIVRGGKCRWENPAYVTVKFDADHRTGKFVEKIYHFRVSTGLTKAGLLGEVSIDFSKYAEASKPFSASLPLQNSNSAVLHIWVQRIQEDADRRDMEEFEGLKSRSQDESLSSYLNNEDISKNGHTEDGLSDEAEKNGEVNGDHIASSGSDITLSSSESSSGLDSPIENGIRNDIHQQPNGFLLPLSPAPVSCKSPVHEENQTFPWKWSIQSDHVLTTDDSGVNGLVLGRSKKEADMEIEELKNELSVLTRRADMSDMELQTLRKQIAKENKRSQDLMGEVSSLKAERDEWKTECQKLKSFQKHMDDAKVKSKGQFEGGDLRALLEEMRQELNYEKDLNANLRLQLQKTQESNTELILAVQDLEEMLEQKNCVISDLYNESKSKEAEEMKITCSKCQIEEDEELKALEDLVKDQKNDSKAYLLEQKVMELYNEIELHMRDKDELGMQMEQIAFDYEILKQENHDISRKLEQMHLQEQLQNECSTSASMINELEKKIQGLENELKQQSAEYSNTLTAISELESHVRSLEEELEKRGQDFEADLEAMTLSKVEHEKRAIRAEEALRKMRSRNAQTAEKLQEEFERLSKQMTSTFEANENVAVKALAEASELRSQRSHLEEALQKANEELRSLRENYEKKLQELSHQIRSNSSQIEQMTLELETKSKQLERLKKDDDRKSESCSQEIQMLKSEIDRLIGENSNLKEQAGQVETMRVELDQMKTLVRETEMLIQTRNTEQNKLESAVVLAKKESDKLLDELEKMRDVNDEKETLLGLLQSELQKLKVECNDLKHSLAEDEIEKEKLRKQILQLKSDLKKEEACNNSEKKLRHNNGRAAAVGGNKIAPKTKSNPISQGSAEVANLKEKIKMLEGQIKLNENALETSENSFLQKEKDFCNRILELENRLEKLHHLETSQKVTDGRNNAASHGVIFEETRKRADDLSNNTFVAEGYGHELSINSNKKSFETAPKLYTIGDGDGKLDKLLTELSTLKEKNQSMESELKDMQERYSEISLKFAEVEGERQQLVMTVRNLKNAKRN